MLSSRSLTPLVLTGFFALVLLAILSATAWSHAKAEEAAKADAVEVNYVPEEDKLPVTDAVPEKTSA